MSQEREDTFELADKDSGNDAARDPKAFGEASDRETCYQREERPHVVPVWFRYDGVNVFIPTNHDSAKARNILHDSRVALTVDVSRGKLEIRGVMLQGHARLMRGRDAFRLNRRIYLKYVSTEELRKPRAEKYLSGDDVTIKISPRKIVSWDFGKAKLM